MAIKNVNVTGGGNMMLSGKSPIMKKNTVEETEFMEHGGKVKVYKLSPEELEKELQRVGFYKKQFKYTPSKKEKQQLEEENRQEKYDIEENENEVSLNELQEEEYDSPDEDDYEEKEN